MPKLDKVKRWYCYADDDLMDCMGRRPGLYDPDEWNHEHDACGFVIMKATSQDQSIQEDWRD